MKEDAVKITEKLISLKSYDGADEPYHYIKELLESAGARVEEIEYEGIKSIHAEIGKGDAEIGFNGHYDTVPPEGDWTRDPLQPTIKDGRLYGLGSTDMKGGLAGMMSAFMELADYEIEGKAIFQAVGDEETYGLHGTRMLVREKKFAKRMYIGEPSGLSIDNEHKSVMMVRTKMHGKSAHGSRVYAGTNAILKMARALQRISHGKLLRTSCQKEEIYDSVSCNIGMINGGKAVNIVPAECYADLDIRMPRTHDPQDILDYLSNHFDETQVMHRSNGMYTPAGDEFVRNSLRIARETFGEKIPLRMGLGACDGRYFTKMDIPTVKGGPCGIDESGERMLHRKDEWVPVEQLQKWREIYFHTALRYLHNI